MSKKYDGDAEFDSNKEMKASFINFMIISSLKEIEVGTADNLLKTGLYLCTSIPNEDLVSRGLIVSICPIPLNPAYVSFIFETATSQFTLNRIQFLKYLEKKQVMTSY